MISDPVNDSMTTDFSPRSRRSVPLAVGSNRHHDADRQARPFWPLSDGAELALRKDEDEEFAIESIDNATRRSIG
jgi:hypothetical protein